MIMKWFFTGDCPRMAFLISFLHDTICLNLISHSTRLKHEKEVVLGVYHG